MITFYVTSWFWEGPETVIEDLSPLTEAGLAKFVNDHPNSLVMVEPSSYMSAFRKCFVQSFLDKDGYIVEGVFKTSVNGRLVEFRIVENINMKLSRKKY